MRMRHQLSTYINEIKVFDVIDKDGNPISTITYYGDGQGDFEKIADDVESESLLENYIIHCEKQINIASIEIKRKQNERNAREAKEKYDN